MQRFTLSRIAPIAIVALAAGLGAYACVDSTSPLQNHPATLIVTPKFTVDAAPTVVTPASAHIIITRPATGQTKFDSVFTLPLAALRAIRLAQLQLGSLVAPITLTIPLPEGGDDFEVRLALLTAGGTVAYQGGPVTLHLDPGTQTNDTLQLTYVGAGATANSVAVTPGSASVAPNDTITFTAHALTTGGTEIPGTPVYWTSLDPGLVSFPDPSIGHVLAGGIEGTAHIRATLLTGQSADATLVVISAPAFTGTPPATSFTVQRAAASPAPATVQLTATQQQITGVGLGTITYGAGATGWLGASLSATSTPATLTLTATTSALPEGTFTASVPITGAGSNTLNYPVTVVVNPLAVTQIVVVTDPAGAASGSNFVTQPVVELRDATNTRVLSATGAITASVATGTGALSGTVTRAAVQGRVTYTDLKITGTGAHTLAFNSGGLPQATSGSFTVAPALSTVQAVASTTGNSGTPIPAFTPVTASGGVAPYAFALTGAVLPAGMNFDNATGQITGTPGATLATTTYTVTVTDATLATSSKTFTLTVNGALATTQAIAAKVGDDGTPIASFTPVTASGGTPAITFGISPAATLTGLGLAFNPATGAISGTPSGTLALTTFTVTATDAIGATSSKTFTLTINSALATTQAIGAKVATNGAPVASFTPVTAAGGTAPTTFSISPAATLAATSLTFNAATGGITGTPTTTLPITTFTVTATDAVGATSSKTFTLTINTALTTTQAVANVNGNAGAPLSPVTPVTAAGGTAPLTFAVAPLAGITGVGLAFDVNTGALSGTPSGAVGPLVFTVTATDAVGATSSKTFTLTVNGPLTTTQLIAAKTGTQGAVIAPFVPVAGAGGTAPIVYSISPSATLAGVGLTLNTATGAISGTPTGTLALTTFTVTATDNVAATSSKTFTLTINPPVTTVLAVPATVGTQGTLIPTFTPVTAAGGTAPITFGVAPLASLTGIGMAFDSNTGAVSGTPTGALAQTNFTVTATDAAGATSQKTFALTVNGPVTTTQAIASKIGDDGVALAPFTPVTAAGGTAPISFAISPAATLTGIGLTFNTNSGAVSGTPTGTLASTTFTVTATDNVGATSSKTFTLQINTALTTTQAVAAVAGDNGRLIPTFTPVTAAGGTAPVTFAVSPAAALTGAGLSFSSATGAVSGTPTGTLALTTFTVTATDNIGATSSKTFTLQVNPVLTTTQAVASKVGSQGTAIPSFTPVTAAGGTAPITFAIAPAATLTGIGMTFNAGTGAVSGTPTGTLAQTTFTVTATDNVGATSSQTFTLQVNGPLNTAQAVTTKGETQGATITPFIPVTASGGTPPITFSISPAATLTGVGLAFNASTGAISGTPTGTLALTTFTVTATDNIGATSSKTFTLQVNPPLTTTQVIASAVGTENELLPAFTPVTAANGTAPITFTVSPAAAFTALGLTLDPNTGAVSGVPNAPLALTTFTVTAIDAGNAVSAKTFTLRVNPAVSTTQMIASMVGDNGVAIPSFTPVTAAGGTAPITFAISPAATLTGIGLSFNTSTGAVSGTPTAELPVTTFTVTATDSLGSASSQTFTLTVNAALATAQVFANTVADVGTPVTPFIPVAASGGTSPIAYAVSPSVTLAAAGLAFNTSTGEVSGTPTSTLALTSFTVTATDSIGATSSKTFTLKINSALSTTQAIASKTASQGTPVAPFIPVTAAGGTAPVTFAISPAAALTNIGLSFDTNTGAVSGTPTGPLALTTFTVTATDNIGATSSQTFTLLVNGPLSTTQAIASKAGTQGVAIPSFIPVTAAGGTSPITFSISPAAALAGVGMSFNTSTGAVSGTPTATLALTTFTVTATDNLGATSSQTFTLQINPALTTTQAVAAVQGDVGRAVAVTPVTAAGGTAPISYAVSSPATLTGIGLSFDTSSGALSGSPSAILALTTFTVTATDAAGAVSSKTFTLSVSSALGTTQAIAVKNVQVGTVVAAFTPVTANGGSAPLTFAISPAATLAGTGLTFNTSSGAISGTPTSALATTTFTVTATDNIGATSSKTFDLQVYTGIVLNVGAAATVTTNGGQNVAIPVSLDMSGRGPDDLAALTITLTWDPAKFTFNAGASSAGSWPSSGFIQAGNPGTASISVTGFTSAATTTNFTFYNLVLTANATGSTVVSPVTATITTAANVNAGAVVVTPRNLSVTINP